MMTKNPPLLTTYVLLKKINSLAIIPGPALRPRNPGRLRSQPTRDLPVTHPTTKQSGSPLLSLAGLANQKKSRGF